MKSRKNVAIEVDDEREVKRSRIGDIEIDVPSSDDEEEEAGSSCKSVRLRERLKSAMKRHLDIDIAVPADRLCPTLGRMYYVDWVQSLMQESIEDGGGNDTTGERCSVVDIGVSASCVYGIMGCKKYGWTVLGSDIDVSSLLVADTNVKANGFSRDITLVHVQSSEPLQRALVSYLEILHNATPLHDVPRLSSFATQGGLWSSPGPLRSALLAAHHAVPDSDPAARWLRELGTFSPSAGGSSSCPRLALGCMTNPPFYDEQAPPQSANEPGWHGASWEMKTTGGELAFLTAIVLDSLLLGSGVSWYTCLVGRRASLKPLHHVLTREGIRNVRCHSFKAGRSIRWAVAWCLTNQGIHRSLSEQYSLRYVLSRGARRQELERRMSAAALDYSLEWKLSQPELLNMTLPNEWTQLTTSAMATGEKEAPAAAASLRAQVVLRLETAIAALGGISSARPTTAVSAVWSAPESGEEESIARCTFTYTTANSASDDASTLIHSQGTQDNDKTQVQVSVECLYDEGIPQGDITFKARPVIPMGEEVGSENAIASHSPEVLTRTKQMFFLLMQQLRSDVVRGGRRWRRRMKMG